MNWSPAYKFRKGFIFTHHGYHICRAKAGSQYDVIWADTGSKSVSICFKKHGIAWIRPCAAGPIVPLKFLNEITERLRRKEKINELE